jgi:hypothetical protein
MGFPLERLNNLKKLLKRCPRLLRFSASAFPMGRLRLYSERAGKTCKLLRIRAIRNGASRCSDVSGSGLGSGCRPLRSYFGCRQFLIVDLVDSAGNRLRILLANFGYRDSACPHRVLNDRGIEIFELIEYGLSR